MSERVIDHTTRGGLIPEIPPMENRRHLGAFGFALWGGNLD